MKKQKQETINFKKPNRKNSILIGFFLIFSFVGVLLTIKEVADLFAQAWNTIVKPIVPVTGEEVQTVATSLTALSFGVFVSIIGTFIGVPFIATVAIVTGLIVAAKGAMELYNYFKDKDLN